MALNMPNIFTRNFLFFSLLRFLALHIMRVMVVMVVVGVWMEIVGKQSKVTVLQFCISLRCMTQKVISFKEASTYFILYRKNAKALLLALTIFMFLQYRDNM